MSDLHGAFVEAFNQRDLARLAALLAPDATAEVLGAPFPVEQGPEQIAKTSLPHLLGEEAALVAEAAEAGDERWVLLRGDGGGGPIDTAIRLGVVGGAIGRLEYVVAPHQPDRLRAIGRACGLATVID